MGADPDPLAALEQLQQRHVALQQAYRALQTEKERNAVDASVWLQQRTRELQAEAQSQKKAETLQRVLYRIAERAAAGLPFYEFLRSVHTLLGELIYAKNCYICLFNADQHTLDFPYYVDERDGDSMQCNDVPYRRGLTEFVLRTQQPQLIDGERLLALEATGDVTEATGDLTFSTWLGVPMQMGGRTGGVLAVQSYEPGIFYDLADADILSFVANHFSNAVERYQALDALRKTEERYRTVIERVGVGVAVLQDGGTVFANPALVQILGYPMDYLLSHPLSAALHPDDAAMLVDHQQRGTTGLREGGFDGIRAITPNGEVRTLELSFAKIEWGQRDATLVFAMDATARLEAEQTQRNVMQRQTELNHLRSRFISMASHEFRTPLATIRGSVELLQHYHARMPVDKKQQTLNAIDEAVQRMTHMLENVLLIGRTEAGQLNFSPRTLAITPLCLALLDELQSAMPRPYQQARWLLDLPDPAQHYWLDETLLRHMVGNLLSNALKYSPHGGEVGFSVRETQPTPDALALVITVSDQGIGIPEADLPELFESFHRASNVGGIAGTGLGLSIVQEAVRCHQGHIDVKSQLGQGSCFTVTLPTARPTPPSPTP